MLLQGPHSILLCTILVTVSLLFTPIYSMIASNINDHLAYRISATWGGGYLFEVIVFPRV